MRKGFKILVLTFILLIPAGIYIFLQTFGHNEFDLSAYLENPGKGEPSSILTFDGLYDVSGKDIDLNRLDEKIIILEFVPSLFDYREQGYQAKRISDIFLDEKSVRIMRVFISKNGAGFIPQEDADQSGKNIMVYYAGEHEMNKMIHSVLPSGEIPESGYGFNKMFLLDNEHKIRGSYLINDFEDIDRLILEVKILLKKEQHA